MASSGLMIYLELTRGQLAIAEWTAKLVLKSLTAKTTPGLPEI
jgi:hypothetical protein